MKRAATILLVIWFLITACTLLSPKPPLQSAAPAPSNSSAPLPVVTVQASPTAPEVSTSSPIPELTATPAPSFTPLPSPTPTPSGIEPENLSSLTQLHTFLPLSLNNLGNLLPKNGPGGVDLNSILSSMFPVYYLSMAYSPDGQTLALGGCSQLTGGVGLACIPPAKPVLRLMDAQTGQIRELNGPTSSVTGLVFSADGKTLVSASEARDGLIRFWDISSGTVLRTISIDSKNGAPALAISPDGNLLVAAWYDNFRVWDFASGKVVAQGVSSNGIPRFSKDGSLMAVYGASDRSTIVIYSTAGWQPGMTIHLPAQTQQFALSPDGKILVTGGDNNSALLHFWDVATGQEIVHVQDTLVASSIVFSPDGRLLVTGGLPKEGKVSIPFKVMSMWDMQTHQKIADVLAPSVSPIFITISADGRQLAFADPGGIVHVWGPADDQVIAARQVLLDYLDDLNQGKYTDAAGLFYSDHIDQSSPDFQFLQQYHPQLDLNNIPGILQAACEDKRFPCAKFRDVVFQGDVSGTGKGISFYVEFAAPDGSALVSPIPCSQVPSTCTPTTAFLFSLMKNDSGDFKLVSLPPAVDFP